MAQDFDEISEEEFSSAVMMLGELLPPSELHRFSLRHSPATVYTTLTTLWMLTLQRLGGGRTLKAIVKEILTFHRAILPQNKRVAQETLSQNPSGFSAARQRLELCDAQRYLDSVAASILDACPDVLGSRRAFILDGTTFTLEPSSELREVYPPASNQHGQSVWPILMLTVAHELRSGAALRPEFGAMYGERNTSEARQAIALASRIPAGSLVLADAGYGIFCVAQAMIQARHDILFRLTAARFEAMSRSARPLEQSSQSRRYRLSWKASAADLRANPQLQPGATLEVELHAVRLPSGEMLYLLTQMPLTSSQAAAYYGERYNVEFDIRDVKVTLAVEKIRARSPEMVHKEILCSMVAYNLVVQLRRRAAERVNLPPRRLSFTETWNSMQCCLLHQAPGDLLTWRQRYEAAVKMASKEILPLRPGRSSPRRAHPRSPKSTKFMKQQAKAKTPPTAEPPPSG